MPRDTFPSGSDESILIRAYGIIRRRWVVATIAFATVLAAIVAFVTYLPDLYRASATVVVERPLADLGGRLVAGDLERRLHLIKQEVLSRDRLTELIKKYNLYPDLRDKMSFEDIVIQARNDIHWEANGPERASGSATTVTFNLTYTGSDPKTVAEVTNEIANFYVAYNDEMRVGAAKNQAQLLKTQVDAARQELQRRQGAMSAFATTNTGQLAQATGVNTATYLQYSDNLRYVRAEWARLDSERRRLRSLAAEAAAAAGATAEKIAAVTGNEEVAPSKELTELIQQRDKAREELQDAQTRGLGANNPEVTGPKARIEKLDAAIAAQQAKDLAAHKAQTEKAATTGIEVPKALPFTARTIQDVEQDMARLKKDEEELQAQMKTIAARFEGSGPIQQQYLVLQREYESARANYDALLRDYERAAQVETVETGRQGERFRVVDAAIVPEGPAAPNRLRLMIMGLLLALAVGAMAVIGAEKLDTSFHSVDDLREYTAVPVIATIPSIGTGPRRGYGRLALGTVSAIAMVVLVATFSAYIANGNEQLVRMLQRAG